METNLSNRIVIAGANGFIGSALVDHLSAEYEVVAITRRPLQMEGLAGNVLWDGKTPGAWQDVLEGAFAVINLTGRSVNCRFNDKNKDAILKSRLLATSAIGAAIENCKNPPKVWLNASGISIYRDSQAPSTESTMETDTDFLAEVTKQWEEALFNRTLNTRRIAMRTSVVLGSNGGTFQVLRRLTQFFLGGKQGGGRQMFSWIHIDDYCSVVTKILLKDDSLEGPVNMVAPEIVSNTELMRSFRKVYRIPFGLPAPAFILKIGAFIIGTEPSLALKSNSVKSEILKAKNYTFLYPDIEGAIENLKDSKKSRK